MDLNYAMYTFCAAALGCIVVTVINGVGGQRQRKDFEKRFKAMQVIEQAKGRAVRETPQRYTITLQGGDELACEGDDCFVDEGFLWVVEGHARHDVALVAANEVLSVIVGEFKEEPKTKETAA